MIAVRCKICGKLFYPTYQHVYKKKGVYYCSWTCYRKRDDDKPKKNVIIPKVGDTIRIISVPGIAHYSNKVGVVEFFDCWGQLHGTWGGWVVIPEEDVFEIIGENNE